MTRIRLDSRVRVPLAELPAEAADAIRAAATHANPNAGKPRHLGEPQTYRTWEHDADGNLTVPRGMLSAVERVLGRNPGSVRDDRRTWRHPEPDFPEHRRTLRDYQEEIVDTICDLDHGIIRSSTGSGKTTACYGAVAALKRRALVMVCSSALMKQWRERALEELGLDPDEVGHIQGDREVIRPLTLAMQQTMANRFQKGAGDLADAFDVLLFDEVQRAPADTVFDAIDPLRAKKRFGVSADESRHDSLEFFTRDLFGPVVLTIDKKRVIESGAVVEVEIACVPTRFDAPWYRYRQDFNKLLDQMTENENRNAQILSLVRSAVGSGEQVIVFTHRVEHARYLDGQIARLGIPGGLMLGGVEEAAEFDRTKMRMKAGQIRAAVGTYAAVGEGIDVPAVARGIAATPMHNNKQKVNQVMGRICRAASGKTHGRLAYLVDGNVYGQKPIRNFVEWFPVVTVWDGGRWVTGREYLSQRTRAGAA